MISSLYAGLSGLLIVWLSLRVIQIRRAKEISLGDGGETDLQIAIRAQGNAVEYIPVSLILLVLLEFNQVQVGLIHLGGAAILAGRCLHAIGLLNKKFRYRELGMQMTLFALVGLALANLVCIVYAGVQ